MQQLRLWVALLSGVLTVLLLIMSAIVVLLGAWYVLLLWWLARMACLAGWHSKRGAAMHR